LELIYFPSGKGNASWHKSSNKLFLGLDHTAMTVSGTEAGVAFYRDLLGLKVGTVTLNTGTTQEVLDGLFNDTCLVTAMLPASAPPHVEFLDYKTPPGGRPLPTDTKANDLWHWQTTLVAREIAALTENCARRARNSSRLTWCRSRRTRRLNSDSSAPSWYATRPATCCGWSRNSTRQHHKVFRSGANQ